MQALDAGLFLKWYFMATQTVRGEVKTQAKEAKRIHKVGGGT